MPLTPAVREDCRHYVMRTVSRGGERRPAGARRAPAAGGGGGGQVERIERCRLGANQALPFACPEGCLFYERRSTSSAGWSLERPPSI